MAIVAPDLRWDASRRVWRGYAPNWPFERSAPPHLADFLNGDRFELEIEPAAAHPAVAPNIWPIRPMPTIDQCTDTAWHTLGDGSLCVVRETYSWTGAESCAALVPRATGWFLEYILMTEGVIDTMTIQGIEMSDELDAFLVPENRTRQS